MINERLAAYSPEASMKMRRRMTKTLRFGTIWIGALGSLTAFFGWKIANGKGGEGYVALASVCTAFLLLSLWAAYRRMQDLFIGRPNLHPYFNGKLPGCALTLGVELLKHSRALDSLAAATGVKRIGEFISDDDFFDGADPTWHPAEDGVSTFETLLKEADRQTCVKAAESDLKSILDLLRLARANGIQFCLLLRDVHVTSQMEWDARKGYC